eukprot:935645-Prorocentrum_lima.AAC.1
MGKPPSFDGSDGQYSDFKFGLTTYMQLVDLAATEFFPAADASGGITRDLARVDAVGVDSR